MSICLIDTSILCEILRVPNLCGSSEEVFAQLQQKERNGESLLVPISTILETGNHIGQNGDGHKRRETARNFVSLVENAVEGARPFTATPFFKPELFRSWIADLPAWAGHGSGLGDLAIVKEFERQCQIFPRRRIYIWSKDRHLSSYRRDP